MKVLTGLLLTAFLAACGGEQSGGSTEHDADGTAGDAGASGGAAGGTDSGAAGAGGSGGSAGNGWRLVQRLLPGDVDTSTEFGAAVAVRGSVIAVGRASLSVGGPEEAVYVFVEKDGTWVQAQKLVPSDPSASFFGSRLQVGVDGTIAVGASSADIGGDNRRGAVYVFERSGEAWIETAKLTASDGLAQDAFGDELALDGDTLLIGLFSERPTQPVYHFQRTGSTWSEVGKLEPSDPQVPDAFGIRIALSGDQLVIGAATARGVPEVPAAAYQFQRSGAAWQEVRKLTRGVILDWFAMHLDLDGDQALVSVPRAKQGDQEVGGVDVFRLADGSLVQTLSAYPGSLPNFGIPVRSSGGRALIGSRDFVSGVPGEAPTQVAAYVRNGDLWSLEGPIELPPGVKQLDEFGIRLAMDGPLAVIAAPADDAMGTDLGAAYVYTTLPP